jgi:hypothetical protein
MLGTARVLPVEPLPARSAGRGWGPKSYADPCSSGTPRYTLLVGTVPAILLTTGVLMFGLPA